MAYVFPAKGHEPGQPRPGTDGPILVYDFDGPVLHMAVTRPQRWCCSSRGGGMPGVGRQLADHLEDPFHVLPGSFVTGTPC